MGHSKYTSQKLSQLQSLFFEAFVLPEIIRLIPNLLGFGKAVKLFYKDPGDDPGLRESSHSGLCLNVTLEIIVFFLIVFVTVSYLIVCFVVVVILILLEE